MIKVAQSGHSDGQALFANLAAELTEQMFLGPI
jgi:hypothetical protein